MSLKKTALLALLIVFVAGIAMAVPPGKQIVFDASPMGNVVFDGTIHNKAAGSCMVCHNKDVFPEMKKGAVKITMAKIYEGKLCGICHNGTKAFDAKGNCNRCHQKK